MSSNAELHDRRQKAIPRGVSNSLAVYAERAQQRGDLGRRGQALHRLRERHLGAQHRAPAPEGEGSDRAAAREVHAHLLPGDAVRELRRARGAAQCRSHPGTTPKKTIFLSTGAEAVENAIKIARFHTKRSAVIAFSGGFHGRTLACISLTGKVQPYKAGFGPMLPEVYHLPFPMAYHGITVEDSLEALEQLFKADVDPARVAAIIIEPVLGEGGFYAAPAELLRQLAQPCATSTASC